VIWTIREKQNSYLTGVHVRSSCQLAFRLTNSCRYHLVSNALSADSYDDVHTLRTSACGNPAHIIVNSRGSTRCSAGHPVVPVFAAVTLAPVSACLWHDCPSSLYSFVPALEDRGGAMISLLVSRTLGHEMVVDFENGLLLPGSLIQRIRWFLRGFRGLCHVEIGGGSM
jgi:hypothetical protein